MPSLVCNKSLTVDEKVKTKLKRETGEKTYPIWLLVNPKHPAVRHNIWSPVLAEIQDRVFKELRMRIDATDIYIRNAVEDSGIVPKTLNWWGPEVASEIQMFRDIALEYKPKILITFGAFTYEFMRRVYEIKPEKGPKAWGTTKLGNEFGRSIQNFDINKTNSIPLLRRVIEGGKFIVDPNDFGENYFQYVGAKIADRIIENKDSFNIWME